MSRSSPTDFPSPLVADASTVINLIATGYVDKILAALPQKVVIVDAVIGELETGRRRGRNEMNRLNELFSGGLVRSAALESEGERHFGDLVIGPAVDTLDDGEAATIAHALESGGSALIDERKATRICRERFTNLRVSSSVDVLLCPEVRLRLGADVVRDALFNALQSARMQVPSHHLNEVVRLVGADRAALCQSLPKAARITTGKESQLGGCRAASCIA